MVFQNCPSLGWTKGRIVDVNDRRIANLTLSALGAALSGWLGASIVGGQSDWLHIAGFVCAYLFAGINWGLLGLDLARSDRPEGWAAQVRFPFSASLGEWSGLSAPDRLHLSELGDAAFYVILTTLFWPSTMAMNVGVVGIGAIIRSVKLLASILSFSETLSEIEHVRKRRKKIRQRRVALRGQDEHLLAEERKLAERDAELTGRVANGSHYRVAQVEGPEPPLEELSEEKTGTRKAKVASES